MTLEIRQIKNNLLKAAAYEADCKDMNYGILNAEEFSIFKQKSLDLKNNNKITNEDFIQAMDLYESVRIQDTTADNAKSCKTTINQPALTKKSENKKMFFGLIEYNEEKYQYKSSNQTVEIVVNNDQCHSYKYKCLLDLIIKYSAKGHPELNPEEVQEIKNELYKIPKDAIICGSVDHYTPARNEIIRLLEKAQEEQSDQGNNVSVKEIQNILNAWTASADYNFKVKRF